MNVLLSGFAGLQSTPDMTPEGLPFWLFWLLLCIILLLLAFIFLRDKNLRRRLSSFLSGARRRIFQIRLQSKLKREKEKKASLWKELGKKAWSANVRAACVDRDCDKLLALDEEMQLHQVTWQEVYSRIETLGRQHEDATGRYQALINNERAERKPHEDELSGLKTRIKETLGDIGSAEKETAAAQTLIKAAHKEVRAIEEDTKVPDEEKAARSDAARRRAESISDRIRVLQEKMPRLHDERAHLEKKQAEIEARVEAFNKNIRRIEDEQNDLNHSSAREMREWQKNKARLQDRITEIKRLMEPLFESMGRALDEARIPHDDLAAIYSKIDGVNKTVEDLHDHIERLR